MSKIIHPREGNWLVGDWKRMTVSLYILLYLLILIPSALTTYPKNEIGKSPQDFDELETVLGYFQEPLQLLDLLLIIHVQRKGKHTHYYYRDWNLSQNSV